MFGCEMKCWRLNGDSGTVNRTKKIHVAINWLINHEAISLVVHRGVLALTGGTLLDELRLPFRAQLASAESTSFANDNRHNYSRCQWVFCLCYDSKSRRKANLFIYLFRIETSSDAVSKIKKFIRYTTSSRCTQKHERRRSSSGKHLSMVLRSLKMWNTINFCLVQHDQFGEFNKSYNMSARRSKKRLEMLKPVCLCH